MLQDLAELKVTEKVVTSTTGDNIVIPFRAGSYIYVYELIGSLDSDGTVIVKDSAGTEFSEQDLAADQGLTESSIPGNDGIPKFKCGYEEDFVLDISAGIFKGDVTWAYRS